MNFHSVLWEYTQWCQWLYCGNVAGVPRRRQLDFRTATVTVEISPTTFAYVTTKTSMDSSLSCLSNETVGSNIYKNMNDIFFLNIRDQIPFFVGLTKILKTRYYQTVRNAALLIITIKLMKCV